MASEGKLGSVRYLVSRGIARGILYLVLILGAVIMVLPFLWMISTSLMTLGETGTGRLLPDFDRATCPNVSKVKLDRKGTVTGFSVSPDVPPGEQELHTGDYYVAVRQEEESGNWQFRIVDDENAPVVIMPVGQPQGALTDEWQPIPAGGGLVETGLGMSVTFADPASYEEGTDLSRGKQSGASRATYQNCCELESSVNAFKKAEEHGYEYTGRPIPTDLGNCRSTGAKIKYFFSGFLGDNYYEAWTAASFRDYMWNSVRITAISLAGMLFVSTLAAYAFGRMKFPGRNLLFAVLLSTMMIPETVTMIPNYLTITGNNPLLAFARDWFANYWYDNWPALTVPFMAGFFNIFLLRQFFAQIPDELWDAARIDGAGHMRFLVQVVLPLSKAPIMTVIIFGFIGSWNALLWPLIATRPGSDWLPISAGLQHFVQEAGPETHLWMAGSSISMLPVLILYFLAQRQFIEGIATTGLKG